eukprot:TRINITY_DN7415_c0_g1_i1.p1 TRINITY_DN7415_c0_g1~~TRINITY_DN7415_c0_g1_i1.p1  ORF type:complete len:519 (+),score=81.91 TRINITY_DN7415_c0_g1_i1:119-1558(+)
MTRLEPYLGFVLQNTVELVRISKELREPAAFKTKLDCVAYDEPLFLQTFLQPDLILTRDPIVIQHVIADNFANYNRYPTKRNSVAYIAGLKLFGGGIFLADGDIWKFHRGTARPFFFKNRLDEMTQEFVDTGTTFMAVLHKHCLNGQPLDIQNLFLRFTLDTFGHIAFGREFNALTNPKDEFPSLFDYAQKELLEFFIDPVYLVKSHPGYATAIKKIDKYMYSLIAEAKSRREREVELLGGVDPNLSKREAVKGKDLLTMLLDERNEAGEGLPDQFLRDSLLNFVIAGRDTTALLLTWTMYELGRHLDFYAQVQREIDDVLKGETPTTEHILALPLLDRVLKEVLRLHPPVPHTGRFAVHDDVLPNRRKSVIKRGDHVRFFHYFVHRNPMYWDQPEAFNPDRWLDPSVIKHKYQYIPFHGGPSKCLGEFMALREAKTLLCMVMQEVQLRLVNPKEEIVPHITIVSPASQPVMITVSSRE